MFTKRWTTRRDETIEFIRTAVVPTNANRRELIADMLHRVRPITQIISEGMGMGHYWKLRRGLAAIKRARRYRRACIAIRCAILGNTVANAQTAVGLIADAALPGQLGALLGQAYNHEIGLLNTPLQNLMTNPQVFLGNNTLKIIPVGTSGTMNYLFFYNYERREYTLERDTKLRGGELFIGPLGSSYRIPYIQQQVYHVRVQKFTDIQGNLGAIVGDRIDATNTLMITEGLTGCSFMYKIQGTNMTAIHVQPAGPENGPGRHHTLALTMRNHSDFANSNNIGPRRVFGARATENRPLDYEPEGNQIQLLGIVLGGSWQIHVQARNRRTMAGEITGHWRVEPWP